MPVGEWLSDSLRQSLRDSLSPHMAQVVKRIPGVNGWLDRNAPREPAVEAFLKENIRPGWVVADVGAHYGRYTRLLADLVGPTGEVIAFEANPRTARRLRRRLVARSNVTIENVAITDGARPTVELFSGFAGRSATWNVTGVAANGLPAVQQGTVSAVGLDEFLSERRLDFAKVDVEGAEEMVLRGMELILRRQRPTLLIETHGATLERACRQELARHGYRTDSLDVNHVLGVAEG